MNDSLQRSFAIEGMEYEKRNCKALADRRLYKYAALRSIALFTIVGIALTEINQAIQY